MSFTNVIQTMNKRGQFIELVGIVLIIGLVVVGSTGVYIHSSGNKYTDKDTLYVGDTQNMHLYKYEKCKKYIDTITPEQMRIYSSIEKAESEGFRLTECEDT